MLNGKILHSRGLDGTRRPCADALFALARSFSTKPSAECFECCRNCARVSAVSSRAKRGRSTVYRVHGRTIDSDRLPVAVRSCRPTLHVLRLVTRHYPPTRGNHQSGRFVLRLKNSPNSRSFLFPVGERVFHGNSSEKVSSNRTRSDRWGERAETYGTTNRVLKFSRPTTRRTIGISTMFNGLRENGRHIYSYVHIYIFI